MNKIIFKRALFALLTVGILSACGEGLISASSELDGIEQNLDVGDFDSGNDLKLDSLSADLDFAEQGLKEAESELNKIDIFSSGSNNKVAEKGIADSLTKVFEKAVQAVEKAKAKITEVRSKVELKLASLDPLNPAHLLLIIKGQEILSQIDRMQTLFSGSVQRLVLVMDNMIAKVDKKLQGMDPKSPLTWAALIVWQPIKSKILTYRDRLDKI